MKRAWRFLAAWSTGAIVSAGTPLLAQTVEPESTVQIEQFHGTRRVDQYKKPPAEAKPSPPSQAITLAPAGPMPPAPAVTALELAHYLQAIRGANANQASSGMGPESFDVPRLARPQFGSSLATLINHFASTDNTPVSAPINIHITNESPRSEPANKADATPKRTESAEFETAKVPTTAPVVPTTPVPATEVAPERDASLTATYPWLKDAANLGGPLLTPIMLLAGFLILTRYVRGHSGPFIRIENVGGASQSIGVGDLAELLRGCLPTFGATGAPTAAAATSQSPVLEEPITAEMFDLGPTFEEERLAREQQGVQQEQGVLRQLFEDNLKLREELQTEETEPALAAAA